jgi:hypothetical protein
MMKRYDKLAEHLVNINGTTFNSNEEAIAIMKERTQKMILSGPADIRIVPSGRKESEPSFH